MCRQSVRRWYEPCRYCTEMRLICTPIKPFYHMDIFCSFSFFIRQTLNQETHSVFFLLLLLLSLVYISVSNKCNILFVVSFFFVHTRTMVSERHILFNKNQSILKTGMIMNGTEWELVGSGLNCDIVTSYIFLFTFLWWLFKNW